MSRRVLVVDAFTEVAFRGNPAGVVFLGGEDWPADEWLAQVAAELHHSETAFLRADATKPDEFGLRWFTPTVEVDLCGHATLASAHAIWTTTGPDRSSLRFDTRSGALLARPGPHDSIQLDFPAKVVTAVPPPVGLLAALGQPADADVYTNDMDLLVELPSVEDVIALNPDPAALRGVECRAVIVTAPAPAGADYDFASRVFAPRVGVDEDPVTGSAHCALGPFWSARLGRNALRAAQLSARGGRLDTEVDGDRVLLTGHAITVLDGTLNH
jgi:predicted PhzF superfamily epimerase YddE/YHI9